MDSGTLKSIVGEFLGTLGQSAALTAVLYNKTSTNDPDMFLLFAAVVITVMIFYYWTSVRLNPFITIAATLVESEPDWIRLLCDLVAQVAGGVSGVYLTSRLLNFNKIEVNKTEEEYVTRNRVRTVITDAIFTFALVLAFLTLTTDFQHGLLIGIGIALVYAASMCYSRGRSGGNINYANRLGIAIATRNFTNLFVYTIGPLIGAIVAVCGWFVYNNKFVGLFAACSPVVLGTEVHHSTVETLDVPEESLFAEGVHPHPHIHL